MDYMTTMIHGLKTSRRNRAIMCDYRARDATRWSEQEQYEARQKYNYRMRKNNIFDEDDIDANLDNQMRMGLGDRMQREIMQKVAFTDGLLNQLKTFTGENSGINKMDYKMDNEDEIKYPVKTGKYNEKLAQNVVEKCPEKEADDEVNDDDAEHDQPTNYTNETCNEKTIDEMVNELITSKHLSQDKLCAIEIMREHFNNVRNGSASDKSYTAPMLLITGSPGTGKSWLIRSITDLSELMELETPVKMAFMGIAAINIDGHTINSFLDVPLEMNKGVGTSKRIKPWDKNKLEAFKQRCDIENLSAIIIDEISMVKPWMLTYIDERLKEARQIYDKPFGGVSIIVLGDFDQQPPIGGSSLPRLAITLLEKEYQRKHNIFYTKQSRQDKVEINSTLCRRGVRTFEQMGHLKLSTQHRCANDPQHMALLAKMNAGSKITPLDLELYKTLSSSDLRNLNELLYATIIVTGNYERQELNSFVAGLWARHFHTHVVRWKKKVKYDRWKGRPSTEEEMQEAEEQTCFYEYFVPRCPAYITHNINLDADLVNGTSAEEHSLGFDSAEEKTYLDNMIKITPIGGIIDLPTPPIAINVELYPDCYGDDQETLLHKLKKRKAWTRGSITNDGRIIIPIDRRTGKYHNESIRACGRPFHYNASTVPMADWFPIELGFCITVPKAQGRTIHKLIVSLSEHPCPFLRFSWEQVYTVISRITMCDDMRLLLQMGNRNTLQYISDLEKDPNTAHYFAGFPRESSDEVVHWDATLAARAAGFLED